MQAFPAPVEPPLSVDEERERRLKNLRRLVITGVVVRGGIVAVELVAWWWLESQTLLVDAVASALDILASIALLAAVLLATRPPDDDHPFGHGRYEPLAGLQLGLLVAGAGLWLLAEQWGAGAARETLSATRWTFAVPLGATVLLALTGIRMRRDAREFRSSALLSEANHYLIDAATSFIATIGLLAGDIFPSISAFGDTTGAVLLAVMMVVLGGLAAWGNVHQIMDRTPEKEYFDRVRTSAMAVDGVLDVEKLRIQAAGPDAHVDIDIEVDPEMTVAASHEITQYVRAAIQAEWPAVREVVVHVEPWYEGDH